MKREGHPKQNFYERHLLVKLEIKTTGLLIFQRDLLDPTARPAVRSRRIPSVNRHHVRETLTRRLYSYVYIRSADENLVASSHTVSSHDELLG